ncbi:hypothetical protein EDD15DRAFT_2468357, partial [Pisolithus albus]
AGKRAHATTLRLRNSGHWISATGCCVPSPHLGPLHQHAQRVQPGSSLWTSYINIKGLRSFLCEHMFYHLPRAPPAFIVSPEQGSPELIMDDHLGAPNATDSLGGDVPPRRSELYGAVSGYNNDQGSEGEASYGPSHRPLLGYEAAVQPTQGYLNFCGVGRFPVLPSPTFSVHPDAPVSLTNASNTQKVDQNIPSGFVANSATYAQNSPIIGMTTSPTHGYYHFNPPSNRYYHSSAAAPSSYMHPRPFDATPKPPAQFSVPGNSESFHSSPVHTGGGLHRPAIPDSEPFVTNRDGPLVDNPASEPFFYPCSFDNCQDWISDNPKQMKDHFELHGVHLGVDPDSPIGC